MVNITALTGLDVPPVVAVSVVVVAIVLIAFVRAFVVARKKSKTDKKRTVWGLLVEVTRDESASSQDTDSIRGAQHSLDR